MQFIKDKVVKNYEVQDGKVLCTIQIDNRWVSNPSLEQFLAQGWEEYTPTAPQFYVPSYEELVVMKIREKYTIDDELAILRQRDIKPDEFDEYYRFVEDCKSRARAEIAEREDDSNQQEMNPGPDEWT